MLRVLRADLYRLVRSKLLWAFCAVNALIALILVVGNMLFFRAENDAFFYICFGVWYMGQDFGAMGIACAILASLFVGQEFSSRRMGAKVAVGGGRAGRYLACQIAVCTICAAVYLSYQVVCFVFGAFWMDWGSAAAADLIGCFFAGLFAVLAYASIFTAVSVCSKSTVVGLAVGVVSTFFVWAFLTGQLSAACGNFYVDPATGETFLGDLSGMPVWMRRLEKCLVALFPTGQRLLIGRADAGAFLFFPWWAYCLFSLVWVAVSAAVGTLRLWRMDLK